ncbi:hypothetical protein CDO44_22370 [Pigmentiphaga sp. NML080357]|uniref:A24 family peptidase n=1 Tax=Pigmentiphaga sp. NML080357 TaxID=2008675 RepID=UPI000B418AA4|nr:prepilin peptidase [Pigmentiphaga sp. NML080357]OVZ55900.1 hypothetical protein CDO44_22370 [Pigmentiphaga sp. NML080357]
MPSINWFFMLFCGAVFVSDMLFRRVFNWLLILGIAVKTLALAMGADVPEGFAQQWQAALGGAAAGLVFMLAFYVFRVMGAGDVKFFAVLGLWLGVAPLVPIWVGGGVLAGIHCLAVVIGRNNVMGQWWALQRVPVQEAACRLPGIQKAGKWVSDTRGGRRGVPYAAYLAVAAVVVAHWN